MYFASFPIAYMRDPSCVTSFSFHAIQSIEHHTNNGLHCNTSPQHVADCKLVAAGGGTHIISLFVFRERLRMRVRTAPASMGLCVWLAKQRHLYYCGSYFSRMHARTTNSNPYGAHMMMNCALRARQVVAASRGRTHAPVQCALI